MRGANYGWPTCEGPCGVSGMTNPTYSYTDGGRDACITGGVVYRGSQFPSEYYGSYFFGDYVQHWIHRAKFDGNGDLQQVMSFWPADGSLDNLAMGDPVKLLEGPDGSLYYVDIGFFGDTQNPAAIRRIRYVVGNQQPVAAASANPTSGQAPLPVGFSSAGSSDPEGVPLSYSWTFGDGGTSTQANPTHTYQNPGQYVARLTVSDGSSTAVSNDLTIRVGTPPTPTILMPATGATFRAGDTITYSGSATDAEDGPLPASAFSWTILFHHDSHIHPGGGPFTNTTSGTLQIPTSGHDFEGSTNYEIVLTVTDSTGLTASTSVTVFPDKVNVNYDTVPSGLTLMVDGISKQTPFVMDDLKGFQHTITAPNQSSGGTAYTFASWSDGGAQTHGVTVPNVDQSLVATYQATSGPGGLVGAYSFNEGAGTTVADASGSGNAGSIGSATWTTAGKYGNALSFNGSSARVTVPDSPSLRPTNAMTLEAWVFPTTVNSAWRDVIYKGADDYYLEGTSSNSGRPVIGGVFGGIYSETYGTSNLAVNVWTHLAATYDGATLRLFVNGTQVASTPRTGAIKASAGPLTFGGDPLYGQYFAGRIDDVRIYNSALTQAQVQTDMATPIGGAPPPDTQPPTAPGNLQATATSSTQINLTWSCGDGQCRCHRLSGRAVPERGLQRVHADRHADRDELQRHWPDRVDQLHVSRPRRRRGDQPGALLGHGHGGDAGGGGHDAADGAGEPAGDGDQLVADQPDLECGDGQRRGDGLSGGALSERGLQCLHADRDADGDELHGRRLDRRPRATPTVSARLMRRSISARTRAPPPPSRQADTQPPTAPGNCRRRRPVRRRSI